jgi:tetratricopeptide (TPR) repeat protein
VNPSWLPGPLRFQHPDRRAFLQAPTAVVDFLYPEDVWKSWRDGRLSSHADRVSAAPSPWIYGPWLDLIVGCGAWSAPLLGAALLLSQSRSHAWVVAFYLLALAFNYPHFMATVYRAYHTRADFEKYKIFTLHITLLLVLTAILLHASYRLFPWVFTLYILWSPWHYTGQNFGLLMMFARRAGAVARDRRAEMVTRGERRSIRAAFVASYLMLLASFETGGSNDPLILSLGLAAKYTLPARLLLGAAFAIFLFLGFSRPVRRHGIRALLAPLTLALTQFIWFVVPTLLELHAQIPQTRYSSGILAVLHSAQYIWITSYYQRREARAAGQSAWRMSGYLVTLVAGGIALFIPGPWIVSRLLHYDFTTSFLIFTAVVNIHHFILDGALWKLRDSRIAGLLIGVTERKEQPVEAGAPTRSSRAARLVSSPAFRVTLMALLFLWGGFDQVHFALGTHEENLSSLVEASRMNPWDSMIQSRIAATEAKAGDRNGAVDALERAVAINPNDEGLQQACARALLEAGRYQEAYDRYRKLMELYPHDPNVLVNDGVLAARLGHADDAIDSWEKAVTVDPNQINAHLYLAQGFDQRGESAAAARHWSEFLRLAALRPEDPAATAGQQISGAIQLADDQSNSHQPDAALAEYRTAISLAEASGNVNLESLAYVHLADSRDRLGDVKLAAASYERGLALDAKAGDAHNEALDWFNYGQFLRRHAMPDDLVYACLLHSEQLLASTGGSELDTATRMRREVESKLGSKANASQKELPELLARAGGLPAYSF